MTQMLLTIMNHILWFSDSLLFHGEVNSGGGEAVSDLLGKNVSSSSHYHPLKATCRWVPGHLLAPPPNSSSRPQTSKDWKDQTQRRGSFPVG